MFLVALIVMHVMSIPCLILPFLSPYQNNTLECIICCCCCCIVFLHFAIVGTASIHGGVLAHVIGVVVVIAFV